MGGELVNFIMFPPLVTEVQVVKGQNTWLCFHCFTTLYLHNALSKVQANFLYSIEDDDYSFYSDEEVVKLEIHNLESIIDATNADDQAYLEHVEEDKQE